MICPQCQTVNVDTAKFCRKCGTMLRHVCANCGPTLTPEDVFCTNCGQPVNSAHNSSPAEASGVSVAEQNAVKGYLGGMLTRLEAADLIRLVQVEPNLEYLFRHALVQDAAYESLLKSDRQTLHRVVGNILEDL